MITLLRQDVESSHIKMDEGSCICWAWAPVPSNPGPEIRICKRNVCEVLMGIKASLIFFWDESEGRNFEFTVQ